jgi:hypothetical protein
VDDWFIINYEAKGTAERREPPALPMSKNICIAEGRSEVETS